MLDLERIFSDQVRGELADHLLSRFEEPPGPRLAQSHNAGVGMHLHEQVPIDRQRLDLRDLHGGRGAGVGSWELGVGSWELGVGGWGSTESMLLRPRSHHRNRMCRPGPATEILDTPNANPKTPTPQLPTPHSP